MREARARQNAISLRIESAVSRAKAREVLYGGRTEDAFSRFEILERRADFAEGRAEALGLTGPKSLEEEICELKANDAGRRRARSHEGRVGGAHRSGRIGTMTGKYAFSLDRHDAKLLGVCSGLGKRFGIDPTFIRIGWVAVPLLTPIDVWTAVVAYAIAGVIGFVGRKRRDSQGERLSDFERMDQVGKGRPSVHLMRTELDANDRRMMAIDDHLASPNHELAREIDALKEDK